MRDADAVGRPKRATQDRVIALSGDELCYRHLGDWTDRDNNSNIEEGLLSVWLTRCARLLRRRLLRNWLSFCHLRVSDRWMGHSQ